MLRRTRLVSPKQDGIEVILEPLTRAAAAPLSLPLSLSLALCSSLSSHPPALPWSVPPLSAGPPLSPSLAGSSHTEARLLKGQQHRLLLCALSVRVCEERKTEREGVGCLTTGLIAAPFLRSS